MRFALNHLPLRAVRGIAMCAVFGASASSWAWPQAQQEQAQQERELEQEQASQPGGPQADPVPLAASAPAPARRPVFSVDRVLYPDPWTSEQKAWLGAAAAVTIMDWGQTRWISKHPYTHHETNRLLGRHPSLGEVNRHFALSMAGTFLLVHLLPSEWRTPVLMGATAGEMYFVIHNKHLNVGVSF